MANHSGNRVELGGESSRPFDRPERTVKDECSVVGHDRSVFASRRPEGGFTPKRLDRLGDRSAGRGESGDGHRAIESFAFLARIDDDHEPIGGGIDDLLPDVCGAAALEQLSAGHLIGTVDRDRRSPLVEVRQLDSGRSGPLSGLVGGRYPMHVESLRDALAEPIDRVGGRAPGAEPDDRAVRDGVGGALAGQALRSVSLGLVHVPSLAVPTKVVCDREEKFKPASPNPDRSTMADPEGSNAMSTRPAIAGLSLSHDDDAASADRIAAATGEDGRDALERLLAAPGVIEAFVLWTCNRAEWYVVAAPGAARDALAEVPPDVAVEHGRSLDRTASFEHLLRVAAGLESMVLGEDQILGQVRRAVEDARAADGIGPVFESALGRALRAGERARSETGINDGVVSLPSAAVKLVRENAGLPGATALVVGAGEMGRLAAQHLAPHADRLVIANRTPDRAAAIADELGCGVRGTGLEELPALLADAHAVVSATGSSEHVLDRETVAAAGETFVVDLAHPRDTQPSIDELPGVTVYDLDRLEVITDKTRRARREAADRVTGIVDEELDRLAAQLRRRRAEDAIAELHKRATDTKAEAVETALDRLDLSPEEAAVVESMADSLVSRLLAAPTANLRGAAERGDWAELRAAAAFDLDATVTVPDSATEDARPVVDGPTTDRGQPGEYASERLDD